MATTNAEFIRDALQLINVLGESESASAEQLAHGLGVLNDLMADWEADGVDLEYYRQVDASAETPVPVNARAGVKSTLAAVLAPYYGKQLSAEFVAVNTKFYNRLVRDSVRDQLKPRNTGLHYGEGQYRYFDITS